MNTNTVDIIRTTNHNYQFYQSQLLVILMTTIGNIDQNHPLYRSQLLVILIAFIDIINDNYQTINAIDPRLILLITMIFCYQYGFNFLKILESHSLCFKYMILF